MKFVLMMMFFLMLLVLIYFAHILCKKHAISYQGQDELEADGNGKNKKKFRLHKLQHWEVITLCLVIYDAFSIAAAYFLALWLRFDCQLSEIDPVYMEAYLKFIPIYIVICIVVFVAARLYKSIWRFAGYDEMIHVVGASIITCIIHTIAITAFFTRMPITYYIFGAIFQFMFTLMIRFSYRVVLLMRKGRKDGLGDHNAMLIGAGSAGQILLKDINNGRKDGYRVCCIIDDNQNKWGRYVAGVPVVGGRDDILVNVEKYHITQILIAIPNARAQEKRDILDICKETGCDMKILPSIYEVVSGKISVSQMKDVAVEDLLGREPIKVDMNEIFRQIEGKTILVTGGGGSIGSELCRQIASHKPGHLIILDIYENNVYDIEQELKRKYPDLRLSALIGSVRDSRRIEWVFRTYKPDIVYHAAAHKHVPLMETSPNEAIKNNVIGTYKTAYAALRHGTDRFVLISTDKAVNPTNIMGASKRLCEMVIQSMDEISRTGRTDLLPFLHAHADSEDIDAEDLFKKHLDWQSKHANMKGRTEFVAVRFGNVLGSNGSVIPLFKKQIAAGGPVTVTHPDIIRYFMTIPEAVSLVLQAGTYAGGGEIFVLDMGDPVKIDTLARNLIKLSGYKPDVDIKICYTGLRQGEKLYEEKLMAEEGMKRTKNKLIHIGQPIPFDIEVFLKQLEELAHACYNNCDDIVEKVEKVVPTFHPVGANPTGKEMPISKMAELTQNAVAEAAAAREKR
ncbi:MAG: nucleoside-diphosphate sugar epimerase/dehydratase [Eubacteriales bacterium]|nr:nucleoside-diphosphate sugar epimerase/dehydratase [Eubacteriales bacterium]